MIKFSYILIKGTEMVNKNLSLLNDKAINDSQNDSLDFQVYSNVISQTLVNTKTPFTIGIYGGYGSGKTSLLNLIHNDIAKSNQNIFNIFYDAWKYESDSQTLLALIDIIESTIINDRYKYHEDTITNMLDYIQCIKKAIQILNVESQNTMSISIEIFQLLKAFENLLEEQNIRLIIYVDNLEKCKTENIIKILNSINMVFDLNGFMFVISTHKELLEQKILNSKLEYDLEYINKIIQLPFFIPILNTKVGDFINNITQNQDMTIDNEIKQVLLSLSNLRSLSPRLLIKIINKIKLCYEIYCKINTNTTLSKNQIISLFAVTCTLEELFRDFYLLIVKNDYIIFQIINKLQNQDYFNDEFVYALNISENHKQLIIRTLQNNFNILKMIFGTEQGKFWLENKNYRISAYEFIKTHYPQNENFNFNFQNTNDEEPINPKQFIPIPGQDFEMSKYVVTNQWFNEFIQAGGYEKNQYWSDIAANIWLMKNKIVSLDEKYDKMVQKEGVFFEKKYKEPLQKEHFNDDLQPIVYITYYEALAFCNYLNDIDTSYIYSIPTKEQWEYVAKGGSENRTFPWGNSWNKNFCNNAQTQLNRTSKIGTFPQGNSKFGISDIAGNVWVWTSSLEKNNLNYLKGGSWNFTDPSYFKVTDNGQITFYNNAEYQHYDIGFYCIRTKKYEDSI